MNLFLMICCHVFSNTETFSKSGVSVMTDAVNNILFKIRVYETGKVKALFY